MKRFLQQGSKMTKVESDDELMLVQNRAQDEAEDRDINIAVDGATIPKEREDRTKTETSTDGSSPSE